MLTWGGITVACSRYNFRTRWRWLLHNQGPQAERVAEGAAIAYASIFANEPAAVIKVHCHPSFQPEKQYVLDVLLGAFLGIDYEFHASTAHEYRLEVQSGRSLVIEDHFFGGLGENNGYLHQGLIPTEVSCSNDQRHDANLPVLFGKPEIQTTHSGDLQTGIDIIASTFFMLSRWEESLIADRDQHNRPNESQLLAFRNGFQHRPMVDEYTELLKRLLLEIGYSGAFKQHEYTLHITHDVDHIARYDGVIKLIKAWGGDVILRKRPLDVFKTTATFFKVMMGNIKDPYDTYDWLMDISEKHGTISKFYFLAQHRGEHDIRYDIRSKAARKAIRRIEERNHLVGIHGSYLSYNNQKQLAKELERLKLQHEPITEGRQHYLRFENPTTWRNWNELGLKTDSTMGHYSDIGFRSGTCHEHPVFDVGERRKLPLIERPMIIMEGPLIRRYGSHEAAMEAAKPVIDACKKHDGNFVFLWHPENFNHPYWGRYTTLYEAILNYASPSLRSGSEGE